MMELWEDMDVVFGFLIHVDNLGLGRLLTRLSTCNCSASGLTLIGGRDFVIITSYKSGKSLKLWNVV